MRALLRSPLFRELLVVYIFTIGLISALFHLRSVAFIANYLVLLTAAILLYAPIIAYWRKREPFHFLDTSLAQLARSLQSFFLFSAVVFPLAFIGNHFYQQWIAHKAFAASPPYTDILSYFCTHLLFVALPEEFFYRGYLQERLNALTSKKWRVLGVSCGYGWLLTAIIFAASHSLIRVAWWHAFIFFPGLAFGWLKERTGTILAPILFHAACNAFAYWVFRAYG